MLINTGKRINQPKINEIVFYQPPRRLKCKDYKPYPVVIKKGCYFSNGNLSNFWEWQRISLQGKLGKKGYGYGNFTIAKGYEIEIKYKIKRQLKA